MSIFDEFPKKHVYVILLSGYIGMHKVGSVVG